MTHLEQILVLEHMPEIWRSENRMGRRDQGQCDSHSQFAFSGANIFSVSMLLRPCDVSKMT